MTYGYKKLKDGSMVPYPIDTQLPKNNMKLTTDEINAIYCCISFAQDLRDAFDEGLVECNWDIKGDDQSKRDWLTKHIGIALIAAHKLAGYDTGVLTNDKIN